MRGRKYQFIQDKPYYTVDDLPGLHDKIMNNGNIIKTNKGIEYYNIPASFDIETTSFYRDIDGNTYDYEAKKSALKDTEKCAIMYIWMININGYTFIGRTWNEYISFITQLEAFYGLNDDRRIIVYVHNLSFEFQFIREIFTWTKTFNIDMRKPLYAISGGVEYRCSYLLSGYNLDTVGKHLKRYKVAKLTGSLDYTKIRHSETPLTEEEINYCINDVKVVTAYIQELIEDEGNITKLPLTKTGFVRKYCRAKTLRNGNSRNWSYINLMKDLKITGIEEFYALQRAFTGGFTHANGDYTDTVLEDVTSYDFTSSYPAVMITEKFPMSKCVKMGCKSLKQYEYLISKFHVIADIEFDNIFASELQDNPISASRCIVKEKPVINNGRIVAAAKIVTTLTEVDYNIVKMFYTWQTMKIGTMYIYKSEYLPGAFVDSILKLYEDKTKLKGVAGMETEYMNSKEMLNSCYGMSVTSPLRDEFTYNGVWDERELTEQEKIEALKKYNESKQRFLFYPWGVYVTAYARRNLFTAIYTMKHDYVYSDTDSVKYLQGNKYKAYFDTYNRVLRTKLLKACKFHGIDPDRVQPKTDKGVTKLLGEWDFDGFYKRFKTLGAKRYMTESEDGKISITVSGVNKKTAVPYLLEQYGDNDNVFDAFTNYLTLPPEATGKNIHTYIDYEITGVIRDYMGNLGTYREATGLHLEPCGYSLSLSILYLNYLIGIKLKG